jgi:hypothetical protein
MVGTSRAIPDPAMSRKSYRMDAESTTASRHSSKVDRGPSGKTSRRCSRTQVSGRTSRCRGLAVLTGLMRRGTLIGQRSSLHRVNSGFHINHYLI